MQQTEVVTFTIIANIILLVFIIGTILFILQYKRKKVEHENEKTMINEKHTQELLSTELEMQKQTMQHIGREIHDSVGQKLTLASLYTQQLAYENKAPQVTDKIENISNIINESLQELRLLSKSLTDDVIIVNDLIVLIKAECEKINGLKKCTVKFTTTLVNTNLPYQVKNVLLRVVQEFLQNSIKHSNCKHINVDLTKQMNFLDLKLEDDGIGFDKNNIKENGIGLSNMEKRTKIIGGNYRLSTSLNKGTQLNIQIPL
ncbi:MAG: two-component sensor histidine kinase [Chitinophagaceae bacterium]|nr:two-component sensor histidine kinase [Chitinophagaceae bacterium]MBP6433020.1 hypothetical protein [Ferruginibacter sp.]